MVFNSLFQNTFKDTYKDAQSQKPSLTNQAVPMSCIGHYFADPYAFTPAYGLTTSGYSIPEIPKLVFVDSLNPKSVNNIGRRAYRWLAEDKFIVYQDIFQKLAGIATMIWGIITLMIILWSFKADCVLKYDMSECDKSSDPESSKIQVTKINKAITSSWYNILKVMCLGTMYSVTMMQLFKRTTIPKKSSTAS